MPDFPMISYEELANNPLFRSLYLEYFAEFFEEYNYQANVKLNNLEVKLNNAHSALSRYFSENKIVLVEKIPSEILADIYFSQLLQNLFFFIVNSSLEIPIKKKALYYLLSQEEYFYFTYTIDSKEKTVFWVDKHSENTVLTTAARISNRDPVFITLLEQLAIIFPEGVFDDHFLQLENYLFYENKLGRSALTLLWLKNKSNQEMESKFFAFSERYYQGANFQKFLFQLDSVDNTAAMRSAAKGFIRNFNTIFDNIKRISRSRRTRFFRNLLLHFNEEGESVVHYAIQGKQATILNRLFTEATLTFGGDNTPEFKHFLQLNDNAKITPLSEAIKGRNRNILKNFFKISTNKQGLPYNRLEFLLKQQDAEGYTALMYAVTEGYYEGFSYLLNLLVFLNKQSFFYNEQNIRKILLLKTKKAYVENLEVYGSELNVFQMASKLSNWKILNLLLDTLGDLFDNSISLRQIDYIDSNGDNTLTRLFRDEYNFRRQFTDVKFLSAEEKANSQLRLKLTRLLMQLGAHSEKNYLVPDWLETRETTLSRRIIDFFSIFCGANSVRTKRYAENNCFFSDSDYETSSPIDRLQRRKEALVNIVSYLKQENKNPLNQIRLMREKNLNSDRETGLLTNFDTRVNDYYEAHGANLLQKIKQRSIANLASAFTADAPYLLVDSQHDLLLLEKNKFFSGALLNPTKSMMLKPNLDYAQLKNWLDYYFSSRYSLHPFDESYLERYSGSVLLDESLFISDMQILQNTFAGIDNKLLREFILANGNFLTIAELENPDFFNAQKNNLRFRAEKFHEIYFQLPAEKRAALRVFMSTYQLSVAEYAGLTRAENEYLRIYGAKIYTAVNQEGDIEAIELLDAAIETHEELIEDEYFSVAERRSIFTQLKDFKSDLSKYAANKYTKGILQLLFFLFPSAVRAVSTLNPFEVVFPLAFIVVDSTLRDVLLKLINHPQILQLFSGELSSKILGIATQTTDKLPVIGSALVVYGLVRSGKALISAKDDDPNKSYYAHLLANHLVTVSLVGAEVAVSFSFWPVFIAFQLLTLDYIVNEGEHIHDVELHLHDDENHPLLKFFRKLKLGLGIVDAEIKLVEEQRQLFSNFMNYLPRITQLNEDYALIAFFLPKMSKRFVVVNPREIEADFANCDMSRRVRYPFMPRMSVCERAEVYFGEKEDYSFDLGHPLQEVCEKRDNFMNNGTSDSTNYTLLAGSQSLDCSLGQTTVTNVIATSYGSGDAGVLVNRDLPAATTRDTNYTVLLFIDPNLVKKSQFSLSNVNVDVDAPKNSLQKWLPCQHSDSYCLKKISVMIMPIFHQSTANAEKTTLDIKLDDNDKSATKYPIESIDYLLAETKQVDILANNISEKKFYFLEKLANLTIVGQLIKSANGFQANLSHTKKLILEFGNASVEGFYQVPEQQQLFISNLTGLSQEKLIALDVSNADFFSISMHNNIQIKDNAFELTLQGNFSRAMLQIARHNKTNTPFVRSLVPFNRFYVNSSADGLVISNSFKQETSLLAIKCLNQTTKSLLKIYGSYFVEGTEFFSRIHFREIANASQEITLEINASTSNKTLLLDIDRFYLTYFDKVSILTKENNVYKVTNFIFLTTPTHSIQGNFSSYDLVGSGYGWIVNLYHINQDEKTQIFIPETINKIIINNISYQVKPNLAALFAINTVDHTPIPGNKLIAHLKIDDFYEHCHIQSLPNKTYKINNISFTRLPPKTKIYFRDGVLPAAYFDYKFALDENKTHVPSLHHPRALGLTLTSQSLKREFTSTLSSFRLSIMALFSFFCMGAIFLFAKRFKRPSLSVPVTAALPLLEIPTPSSARKIDRESNRNLLAKQLAPSHYLANVTQSSRTAFRPTHTDFFNPDINSQLIFARYCAHYFNKFSANKRTFFSEKKTPSIIQENYKQIAVLNNNSEGNSMVCRLLN